MRLALVACASTFVGVLVGVAMTPSPSQQLRATTAELTVCHVSKEIAYLAADATIDRYQLRMRELFGMPSDESMDDLRRDVIAYSED